MLAAYPLSEISSGALSQGSQAQVKDNETHIPAGQLETGENTRVPGTHGNESRASGAQTATRQRPCATYTVTACHSITPQYPTITNASDKTGRDEDGAIAGRSKTGSGSVAVRDHRFTRANRLPGADAFSRVFAKASRSRDKLFTVLSRENGMDQARLGLAISKKHCRKACDRNRLKRLVRESFRQHADELAGLDIVVLGQPDATRAANRAIFSSLARHWQNTRSANPRCGHLE